MKASDFLASAERLPFAELDTITGGGGLVVVAPHPDDESLGCGGLIAAACAAGIAVRLVVVSDGTGSHPGSRRFPRERLRAVREAETLGAAGELGLAPDAVRFLGLPDRHVPTAGPQAEAARDAIARAAGDCAAGAVCVSWFEDPHCDHVASARLVTQARARLGGARILFYPVWGWTLPASTDLAGEPEGFRFEMSRHLPAKSAAIAAHRSQVSDLIDDDPDGFRLTDGMLAHFARPYEILLTEGTPT